VDPVRVPMIFPKSSFANEDRALIGYPWLRSRSSEAEFERRGETRVWSALSSCRSGWLWSRLWRRRGHLLREDEAFSGCAGTGSHWIRNWQIADNENRGLLTPPGFSVVLRLIGHAQAGRPPTEELAAQGMLDVTS
jgi:hypothetical protein